MHEELKHVIKTDKVYIFCTKEKMIKTQRNRKKSVKIKKKYVKHGSALDVH